VMQSVIEKKEGIMPLESILYVGFVVAALVLFAAALAYAEWATRHANDSVPRPAQFKKEERPPYHNQSELMRKAA
jgi:hypothetical protein